MDPLGSAIAGVQVAFKSGAFVAKVQQAEESAKPFINLHDAVKRDHEYAKALLNELGFSMEEFSSQRKWILGVLRAAREAVEAFDKPLSRAPGNNGNVSISRKSKYVLWYSEQMMEMQVSLSVGHASLLQAINLMHLLAVQRGGPLVREPSDGNQRARTIPGRAQVCLNSPAEPTEEGGPTVL